jgi:hypothetical protein
MVPSVAPDIGVEEEKKEAVARQEKTVMARVRFAEARSMERTSADTMITR